MTELTPTGELGVAIGIGPGASAFYSTRDAATGKARGVAVDLGAALAKKLGVPVEYVEFPSSARSPRAGASGVLGAVYFNATGHAAARDGICKAAAQIGLVPLFCCA